MATTLEQERKKFVSEQVAKGMSRQEALKRFYVQTRVKELTAAGKPVTPEVRAQLRKNFESGNVKRAGFNAPKAAAAPKKKTSTNMGPERTGPETKSTVGKKRTGPESASYTKPKPSRTGPESKSYTKSKVTPMNGTKKEMNTRPENNVKPKAPVTTSEDYNKGKFGRAVGLGLSDVGKAKVGAWHLSKAAYEKRLNAARVAKGKK